MGSSAQRALSILQRAVLGTFFYWHRRAPYQVMHLVKCTG
jgi:hypothetical protein